MPPRLLLDPPPTAEELAVRIKVRSERLVKLLTMTAHVPPVILEKERVLLFDATCDLLRCERPPKEEG